MEASRGHRGWTAVQRQKPKAIADGTFNLVLFGLAASVLLSLLPQIGEQVDYLRFLPNKHASAIAWAGGRR